MPSRVSKAVGTRTDKTREVLGGAAVLAVTEELLQSLNELKDYSYRDGMLLYHYQVEEDVAPDHACFPDFQLVWRTKEEEVTSCNIKHILDFDWRSYRYPYCDLPTECELACRLAFDNPSLELRLLYRRPKGQSCSLKHDPSRLEKVRHRSIDGCFCPRCLHRSLRR